MNKTKFQYKFQGTLIKNLGLRQFISKVAGVTFNNDDGESRQSILKDLSDEGYVCVECELRPCVYVNDQGQSEPAIKVMEVSKTNKLIGWIPKTNLDNINITKPIRCLGIIVEYEGTYGVRLMSQDIPTSKQLGTVNMLIKKYQCERPVYDKLIYSEFIRKVTEREKENNLYQPVVS